MYGRKLSAILTIIGMKHFNGGLDLVTKQDKKVYERFKELWQ